MITESYVVGLYFVLHSIPSHLTLDPLIAAPVNRFGLIIKQAVPVPYRFIRLNHPNAPPIREKIVI